MTTRNRTEEFLRLRASHRPDLGFSDSDRTSLVGGTNATAIEMQDAPEWLRFFELIRHTERTIINDQQTLEKLQRKHLLVEFGVSRDKEREQREIEEVMREILRKFEQAEQDMKALKESYTEECLSGPDSGSQMQRKILANVTQCLAQEISTLNRSVRDSHRRYVRSIEKQAIVRSKSSGGAHQQEIEERLQEQAKLEEYLQRGCTPEQIETIMLKSKHVSEQDREYTNILHNVKALHDMFADLHTMVVEQGTILDRIEYNMSRTYDSVVSAKKQLSKAKEHQQASSFTMCFMLLVVLVAGCLLALFIKMIV